MTSFVSETNTISDENLQHKTKSLEIVNEVIANLLLNNGTLTSPDKLLHICKKALHIIKQQPVYLELRAPLNVCGDIHGQFNDLLRIFNKVGLPGETPYLFLGDYVDRGDNSLDVIVLLLAFKVKFPYHIFLLRGNHESHDVNDTYSFKDECTAKYGDKIGEPIWTMINTVFQWLPLAALIEDKILCVHGGISKSLMSEEFDDLNKLNEIRRNELFSVPSDGIVCDLLWADPSSQENIVWKESERGCSFVFGCEVVNNFCRKFGLDLVVRAHEVQDAGYKFYSDRKLVTVFSASNYCGDCGNNGAVLKISRSLKCSFEIFVPSDEHQSIDITTSRNTRTGQESTRRISEHTGALKKRRVRSRTNSPKPTNKIVSKMKGAEL